mgnify:CR=1 FL=1
MGHSAPRYAVLEGLGDAVAATLGDRLLATRFAQGEYCFTVRREAIADALDLLREGKPARLARPSDPEELQVFNSAQLLTAKPVLYVCNVEESKAAEGNSQSARVAEMAARQGAASVVISAKIEEEISQLADEEAAMFLEEMGLAEAGLDRLIRAGHVPWIALTIAATWAGSVKSALSSGASTEPRVRRSSWCVTTPL